VFSRTTIALFPFGELDTCYNWYNLRDINDLCYVLPYFYGVGGNMDLPPR
jgi:hypothetical protein